MLPPARSRLTIPPVKLVKQQINGNERVVLKDDATIEDLHAEAERLRSLLGYHLQPDGRAGRFVVTHRFYRGKYVLMLEHS